MKNFRKIVAILAAVLMFCSVLPMSAFAAEGDVVFSMDWTDGEAKFSGASVVAEGPDGSNCLKWTATGGWSATYKTVPNMDSTKDYTITMMAKGSVAGGMGITIQNGDWGSYWNGPTFDVTTEWQEVVIALPANGIPFAAGTILFKFQDVGVAMDLYVDDLVISEGLPKVPLCENGDFETGDGTNWILSQDTVVDATAARSGSYGAHLIGAANWNSMLERTFDVVAGKKYELTFWAKTVSGGSNIKFLDQNWQGTALADGQWFNKADWTQTTVFFTAISDKFYFQFCGAGDMSTEMYVDDVNLLEVKDPSYDGYLYNGDFETGKTDSWESVWGSAQISIVEGGHGGDYAMQVNAGQWQVVRQTVNVEPNTDYVVHAYAKNASDMTLLVKSCPADQNIAQTSLNGGDDWTQNSLVFNSGDNTQVYVCVMGNVAGSTAVVDDFFMFKKVEESNDGYIVNGTLETGALTPWENLWGSCQAEVVRGGKDDNFALEIVSGEWKHVRQTAIAVEANTDYKISLWAKNVKNMNLLVKDNGDSVNLNNKSIEGGAEWTYNEFTFNTGDYTSIIVSLMGGAAEAYGSFDNIVMEKVEPECEHEYAYPCDQICSKCYELTNPDAAHSIIAVEAKDATCTENGNIAYWYCEHCGYAWADEALTQVTNQMSVIVPAAHTYDNNCDFDCNVCGEYRDAPHNLTTHVEAVVPTNCQEEGYNEHWICADCGGYFMDNGAGGYYETNPAWMYYTGEHVRPEGSIPCAVVACELCGEDTYGESCTRPEGAPECTDVACVNCGETIYGWGHNYNTGDEEIPLPLCGEGDCIYCGEHFDKLYDHENGAWAPCLDGECSYGCGLAFPATESHVPEDCTVGGYCQVCWSEVPAGEHTYDDETDVDCNVCGAIREVEAPVVVYGDADGNGVVEVLDAALVQQYLAGYDVTLNEAAADADGNGVVEVLDAALVQQYLAGYDVTLGPDA